MGVGNYNDDELKRLVESFERLTPALPMRGAASQGYKEAQESIISARSKGASQRSSLPENER